MLKALRRTCLLAALGVLACSGGGGGSSPLPTSGNSGGIPTSANSIAFSAGPGRTDPEGVAPPAASTTVLTWKDSRNASRSMTLGAYLYQYDFSFDDGNGNIVTRSANDDAFGHPGFGYVVSHNTQTSNSPLGKANTPTDVTTTTFAGAHHAIHHIELVYDRDKEGDGFEIKIPVVIEWLVATGRDHPVWSVTWKTGAASNPNVIDFNTYRMDTRGPYGSLNFDGALDSGSGDAIGGVGWGDFGFKFSTSDGPAVELTLASAWTYNTPNTVNFTQAWTMPTNAEMGIVQTKPGDKQMGYPDRVAGRERGTTSAGAYLNKGDCSVFGDNRPPYSVPCIGGWPFQLMNFDWDPTAVPVKPSSEPTGTKLIAWGSPYGWLGASNATAFDGSAIDGTGDRSYATFIVLGPHCRFTGPTCPLDGDVAITIKAVEALGAATISGVTAGALVATLPRGPGATQAKTISTGYNDTYAAYYLSAAANRVAFTFTPAINKPVKNPVFVIQNWTLAEIPVLSVDNATVTINDGTGTSGAFVSYNQTTNELWITLNRTLSAASQISVSP